MLKLFMSVYANIKFYLFYLYASPPTVSAYLIFIDCLHLSHCMISIGLILRFFFFPLSFFSELVRLLGGSTAGIHSMVDEHFGICVVEYMASGAIPIGLLLIFFSFPSGILNCP